MYYVLPESGNDTVIPALANSGPGIMFLYQTFKIENADITLKAFLIYKIMQTKRKQYLPRNKHHRLSYCSGTLYVAVNALSIPERDYYSSEEEHVATHSEENNSGYALLIFIKRSALKTRI